MDDTSEGMAARLEAMARWLSLSAWLRFARREIVLLLCLLVGAASVLAFVEIAGEVVEGDARAVDKSVLLALAMPATRRAPSGHSGWRRWRGTSPASAASRCCSSSPPRSQAFC